MLDTHALLWFVMDGRRLGPRLDSVTDPANEVFVSAVSLFEIVIKVRAGKLKVAVERLLEEIELQRFKILPLAERHVLELEKLPVHADHKDPFDHQLIAQAIAEDMVFLSFDRHAARYPVKLLA